MKTSKDAHGTWVFVVPVDNLRIDKSLDFEFTVQSVTFVNATRLAKRRRKYGLACPVSTIKKELRVFGELFDNNQTFATLRLRGRLDELQTTFFDKVSDELSIISLSQLGYSRRRHNASPALSGERPPAHRSGIFHNASTGDSHFSSELVGKIGPLKLNAHWKDFQKSVFFYDLLNVISGKTKGVRTEWRRDIRNAAILAGQSQAGHDIAQCFLWNVIAIETLLTNADDKYSKSLPERTEAFIGWAEDWTTSNFAAKIKDMYQKRSRFVHTGERNHIGIKDILFSDDILLNVLTNIVRHIQLFSSKAKLIEFSEKVQAERILGMKSKVRPKTLRYLRPRYSKEDSYRL